MVIPRPKLEVVFKYVIITYASKSMLVLPSSKIVRSWRKTADHISLTGIHSQARYSAKLWGTVLNIFPPRVKFVLIGRADPFLDQGPKILKLGNDKMGPDGTEHMPPA